MRFTDCALASAELAEESLVGGQAGVEVSSALGELPTLSFELEVLGDERPVERWRPVGNEMMFLDPGLVVGLMRRELNGSETVDVVVRVPITQGELGGDWNVLKLFEFGPTVVFPVGDANACGADIEVAMLVIASLRCNWVEVEFDIDSVGGEEVVIMVCVGLYV